MSIGMHYGARVITQRMRASSVVGAVLAALLVPAGLAGPNAPAQAATASTALQVGPNGAGPNGPVNGLLDDAGREVVLRGFNVTASTKLASTGHLPFRSTADAVASAQAMRDLTGASVVRLLVSWEGVQPTPTTIDEAYLAAITAQVQAFTDRGIRVFVDWHQDIYAAALFGPSSWYSGNGAPRWVIDAGRYPKEFCGICVSWGQNALNNQAVKLAFTDLWTNAPLTTPEGVFGVQDAYIAQLGATVRYLATHLPAASQELVLGVDPFNEPSPGTLDPATFEPKYLMGFYQRVRAAMDAAGWARKPAMIEPNVFWNNGFQEAGGFDKVPAFDERYIFNTHLYDGFRFILNPFPASDGEFVANARRARERGRQLNSVPFVTEFGNAVTGSISAPVTPTVVRAWYQAFDSGLKGSSFWADAATAGTTLSAAQWQWDPNNGRHREPYNGDPNRIVTEGDAFNGEDFSVVRTDDSGAIALRLDERLLDRVFPAATAGHRLAFGYEDLARARHGDTGPGTQWMTVPSSLPTLRALAADRQYAVLVWRERSGTAVPAPTELHLPRSFGTGSTVVVSDLGTTSGLSDAPGRIRVAGETGSTVARKLVLDATGSAAGALHVALVVNRSGATPVTAATLETARTELTTWAATRWP